MDVRHIALLKDAQVPESMFLCHDITNGIKSRQTIPVERREIHTLGKVHILEVRNKHDKEAPDKVAVRSIDTDSLLIVHYHPVPALVQKRQ